MHEHSEMCSLSSRLQPSVASSWASAGWRLGYLAAPEWVVKAASRIQGHSTSGASSISQHAGIAALGMGHGGGQAVAEMVAEFQRRRVSLHCLCLGNGQTLAGLAFLERLLQSIRQHAGIAALFLGPCCG